MPVTVAGFAQNDVNQFRMLPKSVGLAAHALSQTPAVPALNGATFGLEQKQEAIAAGADVTPAGAQAPLASNRGPHCPAQAGRVENGTNVSMVNVVDVL